MWNYYKDKRTDNQVLKDYNFGKKYEKIIFDRLNHKKFWINTEDKYKTASDYKPDCFIFINSLWIPVEIKYTKYEIQDVELKKNQCDKLAEINGWYWQATPTKFLFISAKEVKQHDNIVMGYCNKECYRIFNPNWKYWKTKII